MGTPKQKPSEVAIGKPVIAWLQRDGWDVFQEVQPSGGSVADIVAVKDNTTRVIELKSSLSFELLAQASHWRLRATEVYVAVPHAKRSDGRNMAMHVFKSYGIGIFEVHDPSHLEAYGEDNPADRARVLLQCTPDPSADGSYFLGKLRPEHKTFAEAGSSSGGHFTEFKATCERLRQTVAKDPGITVRGAVLVTKHHYSTNKSAQVHLGKLIEKGVIKGISAKRDASTAKRELRLYPGDAA